MTSTTAIMVIAAVLFVGTVIPGVRLYWPQRRDPLSRTDLGVALMTGALIAFAVLVLQILVELRAQKDATDRAAESARASNLLLLGRQKDLSGVDLRRQDLPTMYLVGKTLRGANFTQANLTDASLEDANLIEANLADANLDAANLSRADLRQADLAGTSFVGATLTEARLDGATMSPLKDGGRFVRVDLTRADLSSAWARADLRGAILVDARLVGTRLDPADLQGADLTGADLEDAQLHGANLQGANLSKAVNLDIALDLSAAIYDRATRWPAGMTWNDKPIPKCLTTRCRLSRRNVDELSAALTRMRSKLTNAIDGGDCLTGWRVDDELLKVAAHTLNNRATFRIQERNVGPTKPPIEFAGSYGDKNLRTIIKTFKVDGSKAYAASWTVDKVDNVHPSLTEVGVYVVPPTGTGIRFVASASPALFPLFERDFAKLFRLVGVQRPLFPFSQESAVGCKT